MFDIIDCETLLYCNILLLLIGFLFLFLSMIDYLREKDIIENKKKEIERLYERAAWRRLKRMKAKK